MGTYCKQFYHRSLVQFVINGKCIMGKWAVCVVLSPSCCVYKGKDCSDQCAPTARCCSKCDTQYCAGQPCLKSCRIHTNLIGLKF